MKKVMTGTEAAALAAQLARVEVVSAYPITPQTVIVEKLAELIGEGRLKAAYLNVESEHSAMASCIGASAVGARVFTATSSQGLALMHEVLHYAAGGRFPIVMVNANRALTPPWNLYCDHTDSLAQRDTGWLQYYCKDCQDVLDSILMAFKVAERVLLPIMINLDAFYLTHTSEAVSIPLQEDVDQFLPPYNPEFRLDINNPRTLGNVCGPELYTSFKYIRHNETAAVADVWAKVAGEFDSIFGRRREAIEHYRLDDAEIVVVIIGTAIGAVRLAVDHLREKGYPVGCLRLCLIRPFPRDEIYNSLASARKMVVIDRDISSGTGGIIAQELKSILFNIRRDLKISNLIMGIGGLDITPEMVIKNVIKLISEPESSGFNSEEPIWAGVL